MGELNSQVGTIVNTIRQLDTYIIRNKRVQIEPKQVRIINGLNHIIRLLNRLRVLNSFNYLFIKQFVLIRLPHNPYMTH